ncbi:MAG: tricarballylate utilization 4Fe-4S protein TcuB [Acidimicrobiia bacterium]|nr:tricarballylate utilization 4Fe-4S protein TcuB [Acidimicrobiia bacterium]
MQAETLRLGQHVMTVCNACRYCEQYCPVFPAMERRLTFTETDLNYLANLCHNCGECLYACQYAPPHEFGINVPRTLARIRLQSYEEYCWPRVVAGAFRHHGIVTACALVAALVVMMLLAGGVTAPVDGSGNFYAVIPHHVMVTLFGGVSIFVLAAFGVGMRRFWRNLDTSRIRGLTPDTGRIWGLTPVRDVLTLRHLHATGVDCTTAEETRSPWRRWFHHCTFYGFLLCFASTTVAALYHMTGSVAPYAYTSLPVILGTSGGIGLLVGPAGLFLLRARRDPALGDPAQDGLDEAFILLLLLTSLTGLALLVLRHQPVMGLLLVVHLSTVLALFVTLPYGKFVHGLYRAAALAKFAAEEQNDR